MYSKKIKLLFWIIGIVSITLLAVLFYLLGWPTYCEKNYKRSLMRDDTPIICPKLCKEKFFEDYDPETDLTAFGYECVPRI